LDVINESIDEFNKLFSFGLISLERGQERLKIILGEIDVSVAV
jgi:hypothetical protein